MRRTNPRNKNRKKKSTRQFINAKAITAYSLVTYHGEEIAFFIIKPTNISVLSPENLSARINALMNVLKGLTEFEMLCLDSRESFENNKQYLRRRMDDEKVPEIKALLEKDTRHLDLIQVQMATAREFLLLVRMRGLKKQEVFPFLSRIEKMVREQGFKTRRVDNDDIKRIMAVYWEQNVTTEHFEDCDGERWVTIHQEYFNGDNTD